VIISGDLREHDLQARVRSANRSANGNQLTLARERQAKQSSAFFSVSGTLCPAGLWLGILRRLLRTT
jgi:hypothetical protein